MDDGIAYVNIFLTTTVSLSESNNPQYIGPTYGP